MLDRGLGPFVGVLLFVLCTGCPSSEPTRVPSPPSVTLIQPDDSGGTPQFAHGAAIEFVARVSDSYDAYADLQVEWSTTYSDGEGSVTEELGTSEADAEGLTTLMVSSLPSATHSVSVTVTDTDSMTATDSVQVEILPDDLAPTVAIDQPTDASAFVEGDDITFVATATDEAGPELLAVSWTSNLDGEFDTTSPSEAGVVIAVTGSLSAGDHTIRVTVTDDSGLDASDEITIHVAPANMPPSDPTVTIQPLAPTSSDDLLCIAGGSTDPDGDQVTYEFSWLRDGSLTGITTAEVTAADTTRGEEWTCQVVAGDGQLTSNPVDATVFIENSPGSYLSVTLSPTPAYEMDTLSCSPSGWDDADGDAEGAFIEFWVGGIVVQDGIVDTLTGASFDKHDTVECAVYPDDGTELGDVLVSNAVTISNTPPSAPGISITPASPGVLDDLVCAVDLNSDDDDPADTVTYGFSWLVGGQPTAHQTDTVPAADTALGESWTCRVTPNDGEDDGAIADVTVNVLPSAGDVVIDEVMVDPFVVADSVGEWFELYNASGSAIAMDGWVISDLVGQSHAIASGGSLVLSPGDYVVLGNNANQGTNGEVPVDYQYTGFDLDDGADAVVLSFAGVEVDRIEYDTGARWPDLWGQAMVLDPAAQDHVSNDDPANWCGSTTLIDVGVDFGTPGAANDECACFDSDDDGDGFGDDPSCEEVDCDDGDWGIYPHADESCNELDDDCDGWIDELPDYDLDGFDECDDCDNWNYQIHPDAEDLCDGIDNDCDGVDGNDDEEDVYEPNDSRGSAFELYENQAGFGNCPSASATVEFATIESVGDEDWFAIYQSDGWDVFDWCVSPGFQIDVSLDEPPNLSLYVELYRGNTWLDGGPGTTFITWAGDGLTNDADWYYIRVVRENGTPDPCEYYELQVESSP